MSIGSIGSSATLIQLSFSISNSGGTTPTSTAPTNSSSGSPASGTQSFELDILELSSTVSGGDPNSPSAANSGASSPATSGSASTSSGSSLGADFQNLFNDVQTLFSDLQQQGAGQGLGGSQGTLTGAPPGPAPTDGAQIATSAGDGSSGTASTTAAGNSGAPTVGSSFGTDLKTILADLATIFGDLGFGWQTSPASSSASSTSTTDPASASNSASSTGVGSLLDASA